MNRVILLLDMNAYFASVEQVINPALRGKPVAVCGEGRTVITTASYEARRFGVKTGMTFPQAKRICPALIAVPGNYHLYSAVSREIQKILLDFTDNVEPCSIDECYMDITRLCKVNASARDIALDIKKRIYAEFRLTCSIGIGPNKVIAKLASKMQKPDGLVIFNKEDVPGLFERFPVEDLQGVGVGKKVSGKLIRLGITTAGQLGGAPISLLCNHFGVFGYYLKNIGNGHDDGPVKNYYEHELPKSVGHSHTLPRDSRDIKLIKSLLLLLSEKVGVRLRAAGMSGKTVSVTVRYADFTTFSKQAGAGRPISGGCDIYASALAIFKKLLPLPQPVRLLGVSISSLSVDDNQQFLFEGQEKLRKLAQSVDAINKKFGAFTLKPASLLIAEKYGAQ
ncbi:MAG: hypothetical protein A2219_00580 [Elusimicrobia bacterium RIFOXYA2_FULL_50_26]|nr:MAG: hypothetical protein A2219_00580 [Elusimicrobia bacterium RIFOXYA2_FULL_50_26]